MINKIDIYIKFIFLISKILNKIGIFVEISL